MPRLVPTEIKKMKGTLQKCRTNFNEPTPTAPLTSDPPKYLKADEKKCWRELVGMVAAGVLTGSDRWAAEICCILMATIRRREPLNSTERAQLTNLLAQMGLTPASRSRVVAVPPKDDEDDFSAFLN